MNGNKQQNQRNRQTDRSLSRDARQFTNHFTLVFMKERRVEYLDLLSACLNKVCFDLFQRTGARASVSEEGKEAERTTSKDSGETRRPRLLILSHDL